MLITKTSILTNNVHTCEINITEEQLNRIGQELIQLVVPHLSADDREFLINGITAEEYDAIFGDE